MLPTWISHRFLAAALFMLQLAGLAVGAPATPDEIVLERGGSLSAAVDHGVEMLIEEPGENLTPQRAMGPEMATRWSLYPGKNINLAYHRKPAWFRFNVRHEAEPGSRWLLAMDWPMLKHIDFYQLDAASGALVASHSAGLARPPSGELLNGPTSPFPIEMGAGQRVTVLMRVETDSLFTVPLMLWETREFHAKRYDHAVAMGLLFGILGAMLLYNLSLYVFTRERSFLWYTAYLLTIVLYELTVTGYGPFYLWGGSDWVKARGYEFFGCLSFLTATIFFRDFLNLKHQARHIDLINRAFIVLWVVCVLMSAFPPTPLLNALFLLGALLSGVVGIYSSVYLGLRGNVLARYFGIAWFVLIAATNVLTLAMFGVIERTWWAANAQHIGFVVEVVLLSIALAERIKRERASKVAAQRQVLAFARKVEQEREEKIRAQEHALTVQLKANEELEMRVQDRTAELKRALEHVALANVELAQLSVTDALTQVHNRRYFDETLKKELARSSRTGAPLALLLADIDHFKRINDSVGHLAGDECLKLVATTLARTVGRATDLVARYGGEEFAIVLPATDAERALEVAERMRRAVEGIQFIHHGRRIPISISLGVVARVARAHTPVADFVSEADQALYAAKGAGRNRALLAVANG